MELIDKAELINCLKLLAKFEDTYRASVILGIIETVKRQKPVDAVPVVHGYWKKSTDRTFMSPCYECSNCGRKINTFENPCKSAPYCHCGSKMDESE